MDSLNEEHDNITHHGNLEDIAGKKALLRQDIKDIRYNMAIEAYETKSRKIFERVCNSPVFLSSNRVCCYVHKDATREVQTRDLLNNILVSKEKELIVPITRVKEYRLDLSILDDLSNLVPKTFNVLEPVVEELVPSSYMDCIIVPCLAVDIKGNRLGYGKGYYDRLLGTIPKTANIPIVALAFEFQVMENVPVTVQDVPVTHIITETRFITCQG